jgi:invasion protein IalB
MQSSTLAIAIALGLSSPFGSALAQNAATPAPAEQGTTHLGGAQGWEAYSNTEKTQKICYIVGEPSSSEPANAKRGKIYASVTHRPGEKVSNEVSFNAGYLFKEGSDAELTIDGKKFSLFTNKDGAWGRDAAIDKSVVDALSKGKQAVIKGVSARGTATTDTYALAGFGQALTQIDKACSVKR